MGKRLIKPRNQPTLYAVLCAAVALAATDAVHAQIKVNTTAPVLVQDYHTTIRNQAILKGPGGTRSITSEGTSQGRTLPGYSSSRSNENILIEGVQNPGITYQQRTYYVPQPGQQPGVIATQPVVEGGPGSVTRSSESETRSLPPVRVRVGR